jgi:hypothetical protein
VRLDDFLKAELAGPFRTFTDDELISYSVRDGKMNFAPGTASNTRTPTRSSSAKSFGARPSSR